MKKIWLLQKNIQKTKLKAFTLLEMVIVMILLGIMTMMTLQLSTDQIEKVQHKAVKEEIIQTYQKYYTKNLVSSYFSGSHYKTLNIHFTSGENQISFSFSGDNDDEVGSGVLFGEFKITSLSGDETTTYNQATVSLTPFHLACAWIFDWVDKIWTWLWIRFLIQEQQEYCFEISSQTCRMREVECSETSD